MFKNNNGFTMIEMILSLSVLLIILSLIPLLIKSIYQLKENAFNHTQYEIIMFRNDLSTEVKDKHININNHHNRIEFTNNHERIEYKLLNSKIYKSINGKGVITLLNNVVFFEIERKNLFTVILKIDIKEGDRITHEEIYI